MKFNAKQQRVVNLDKGLENKIEKKIHIAQAIYILYYVVLQTIIFEPVPMTWFLFDFSNLIDICLHEVKIGKKWKDFLGHFNGNMGKLNHGYSDQKSIKNNIN